MRLLIAIKSAMSPTVLSIGTGELVPWKINFSNRNFSWIWSSHQFNEMNFFSSTNLHADFHLYQSCLFTWYVADEPLLSLSRVASPKRDALKHINQHQHRHLHIHTIYNNRSAVLLFYFFLCLVYSIPAEVIRSQCVANIFSSDKNVDDCHISTSLPRFVISHKGHMYYIVIEFIYTADWMSSCVYTVFWMPFVFILTQLLLSLTHSLFPSLLISGWAKSDEHLILPWSGSFCSFSHFRNRNACCNLITKQFHIVQHNKSVYYGYI